MSDRTALPRYAWLLVAAAILTLGLKTIAYLLTSSVGLLSDALESLVNLAAALLALTALRIASQPPDERHTYGHEKAEYFSSGVEGALIIIAAVTIVVTSIQRMIHPQELQQLDLGLMISVVASIINFSVARVLRHVGQRNHSIALEASAQHLMTDVWTSIGVLAGVGAVALTRWFVLDPFVALSVGGHIAWTGLQLVRRSARGLMDTALPESQVQAISAVLGEYAEKGVAYHALRTRQSGARSFVSVHIQVPGNWSVQQGHDLLEMIEKDIRRLLPSATVFTHLEPIEDPRSWADEHLDRVAPSNGKAGPT